MSFLDLQFYKALFDHYPPASNAWEGIVDTLKADPKASLSEENASDLLDYVIWKTREQLDSVLKTDFHNTGGQHGNAQGIYASNPDFMGYCGFSQIVSGIGFLSLNLEVKGAVFQSIDPQCPHPHAFNTLQLNIESEDRLFLIDVNNLRCGYIELTPETAHEYLTLNFDGNPPFSTPEESFVFMKDPWPHEHIFDPPTASHAQRHGKIFTLQNISVDQQRQLAEKAGGEPFVEALHLHVEPSHL